MHIYLKNNLDKLHAYPIWNDRVLDFFEERRPNINKRRRMGSVPDPKSTALVLKILINQLIGY